MKRSDKEKPIKIGTRFKLNATERESLRIGRKVTVSNENFNPIEIELTASDRQRIFGHKPEFDENAVHTIIAFVNCTPKNETCFWDYTLAYKDKKKNDCETHVDSNALVCYFERV